jgi:hypothetical protein
MDPVSVVIAHLSQFIEPVDDNVDSPRVRLAGRLG